MDSEDQETTSTSKHKRFKKLGLISKGEFTEISAVQIMSPLDKKGYALKKITITSEKELLRRNHEFKILSHFTEAHLNGGNILRYSDSWFEEANDEEGTNETQILGIFYIRTELCSTFTVRDVIDGKLEIDVFDKSKIMVDILFGVCSIHKSGIIHCDLKPENILLKWLSNEWVPKISGFGSSITNTMLDDSQLVSSILCHMRCHQENLYKPPELMELLEFNTMPTTASLTDKVDVYSLAIIIFELTYPMSDTDRVGTINGLREQNPKFPTDINAYFTEEGMAKLKSMLHFNPSKRPPAFSIQLSNYKIVRAPEKFYEWRGRIGLFRSNFNELYCACPFQIESKQQYVYHLRRLFNSSAIKNRMDLAENLRRLLKHQGFTLYSIPCTSTFVSFERSKKEFTSLSLFDNIVVEEEKRDRRLCPISDMRLEFARSVAVNGVEGEMKRFDIQRLITPNQTFIYYAPEEKSQCAFDIVASQGGSDEGHTQLIELLKVLDEIANQFMRGKLILILNHTDLIGKVNESLTSMPTTDAFDKHSKRCDDTSDCLYALKTLSDIISSLKTKQFSTELCASLNLNTTINGCMYFGVIFELECTYKEKTRRVAFGGEYRPAMQFQQQFNFLGSNQNLVAAGVTINIDNIADDENEHEERSSGSYAGLESSCGDSSDVPTSKLKLQKDDLKELQANKEDLSNFKVMELIGEGCYGHVYKVINNLDGEMYALKKIPLREKDDLKSIRREVEIISKLYHENVVRYIEAIIANVDVDETLTFKETKDSIYVYIQMELCEESLCDLIKSGRLCSNQKEQRFLLIDITVGLNHIHTNGVVHRDLKPSNILLHRSGRVKIADFGFSITNTKGEESHNDKSEATYARGAYNYLAPELRSIQDNKEKIGIEHYSQSSDIYSLGLIYFEIFYPMQEWERGRIMKKLRSSVPQFPADIHKYMEDVDIVLLRLMLDHNAERRPNISDISGLMFVVLWPFLEKVDPWNDSFDENLYSNKLSENINRLTNYGSALNNHFHQLLHLRNSHYELHNTKSTYESYYSAIKMNAAKTEELTKLLTEKLSKSGFERLSLPSAFRGPQYNNRACNWYLLHSIFGLYDSMKKHGLVYIPEVDMRRSMVAYVAINNITDLKSFDVGHRLSCLDDDFPFDFSFTKMFCTFDCIKCVTSSHRRMEAHLDVMSALNELINLLDKYGYFGSVRFELHVNHKSLESLILQSYNISDHLLNRTFIDTAHFKDLLREASNGEVDKSEKINAIFEHIDDWMKTIRSHNFNFITKFSPSLPDDFYSGIMFVLCAYPMSGSPSSRVKLIAHGGDYSDEITKCKQELLKLSGSKSDDLLGTLSDVTCQLRDLVAQPSNDQVGYSEQINTLCTALGELFEAIRSPLVDCTENTDTTHVVLRENANVESSDQQALSPKMVAFGCIIAPDWDADDELEEIKTQLAHRREKEKLIFDELLTKITKEPNNMRESEEPGGGGDSEMFVP